LIPSSPSRWCQDLVTPTWKLFQEAIRASSLKAQARPWAKDPPRKYVLIGTQALPIKPMRTIREVLFSYEASDFCFAPEKEWASHTSLAMKASVVKHHQWVILNHEDAQRFSHGWELANTYQKKFRISQNKSDEKDPKKGKWELEDGYGTYYWSVPRMGSNGFANFSDLVDRNSIASVDNSEGKIGRCPDEEALGSMVFGLHEERSAVAWKAIINASRCRTYVNWQVPQPPEVFHDLPTIIIELSKNVDPFGPLFARKFDDDVDFSPLVKDWKENALEQEVGTPQWV